MRAAPSNEYPLGFNGLLCVTSPGVVGELQELALVLIFTHHVPDRFHRIVVNIAGRTKHYAVCILREADMTERDCFTASRTPFEDP